MTPYKPFSIYSSWGFHDELGDTVELSEEMALTALDQLEKWQKSHNFHFDYYHLDCFWFDKKHPYTKFNEELWPNGHEAVFERAESLGMKTGLWYSVNGHHMNPPSWANSKAKGYDCHSLLEGNYADEYEAALIMAAEKWGVRLFKFDFATFRASVEFENAPREFRARALKKYKDILRNLKKVSDDIRVIVHCGFARTEQSTVSGSPLPLGVDLSLLEVVDGMFPGDPHPIDIPQTELVRNIDIYQDRQVWALHQHGFPIHRIEDHGVLMGTTNTACYRGREGFKRSCLGQLARGCRRHFLYGNPTVLNDSDVIFMDKARTLYFDAYSRELTTCIVGDGEPGLAPWHGYLTGGGECGLLYVVNPHMQRQRIQLPVTDFDEGLVLYHDGNTAPRILAQADLLTIELEAEQLALVGIGSYADSKWSLGEDDGPALPGDVHLLPMTCTSKTAGEVKSEFTLSEDADVYIVCKALSVRECDLVEGLPHRMASQFVSGEIGSDVPTSESHNNLIIDISSNEESITESKRVPDVPIWAGISWVAKRYTLKAGSYNLTVTQKLDPLKRMVIEAYRLS